MPTVFVLTTLMGEGKAPKEWRPVAVVTSQDVADQWAGHGSNNDWIPFEVDDLSLTGLSDAPSAFKPKPPTSVEQKAIETAQKLEATNQRLLKIVEQLQERLGMKSKKTSLLEKKRA